MPLWLTGTRACCGTIARTVGIGTESCCLTNCFDFLVCHQLVPHLVPNFPRVPLRNVSWGLGVCAVLVRSVSPCRLVPEVRLFSPPCAVFGRLPVVCPLFSSSCLSGLTRLWPGVCVCNILTDVKLLSFSFFLPSSPFLNNAGGQSHVCS